MKFILFTIFAIGFAGCEPKEDPASNGKEDPASNGNEDPASNGNEDPASNGNEDPAANGKGDSDANTKGVHSLRPTFTKDKLEAKLGGIGAIGENKCVPVIITLALKDQAIDTATINAATAESLKLALSLKIDAFGAGDTASIYNDPECQQLISAEISDDETYGPYEVTIPSSHDNIVLFLKGSNTRTDGSISQVSVSISSEDLAIAENYDKFTGSISDEYSGATTKFGLSSPSPIFVENCHWLFVCGNNDTPVLYKTGVDIAVSLTSTLDYFEFFSDRQCANKISQTVIANGHNCSLVYFIVKKEHPVGSAFKLGVKSENPAVSDSFDFDAPSFEEK